MRQKPQDKTNLTAVWQIWCFCQWVRHPVLQKVSSSQISGALCSVLQFPTWQHLLRRLDAEAGCVKSGVWGVWRRRGRQLGDIQQGHLPETRRQYYLIFPINGLITSHEICPLWRERHFEGMVGLIILICVIIWKCLHAWMFREHITILRLSTAAAPLFSLCLKSMDLAPVSLRPPSSLLWLASWSALLWLVNCFQHRTLHSQKTCERKTKKESNICLLKFLLVHLFLGFRIFTIYKWRLQHSALPDTRAVSERRAEEQKECW